VHDLARAGKPPSLALIRAISLYNTAHLEWFGRYWIDSKRVLPPLTYTFPTLSDDPA